MTPGPCPVCAEPGGFHDRARHAALRIPTARPVTVHVHVHVEGTPFGPGSGPGLPPLEPPLMVRQRMAYAASLERRRRA